tara:strand:+ start:26250 stop:27680 length:1431 start_codon:yes stop_codon:yes gene_type:complete
MANNPMAGMDVTGPIQPNDIVMRASEIGTSMPGIGALAYKQARKGAQKGIKGIHMIPETTNQNMDFMGIAKQNVDNQLTNMASTVEAASAPPGHMLAFITPEEAGVLKLLGGTGEMTSAGIPAFPPEGQYGQGGGGINNPGNNNNQGGNNDPYGGGPGGLHSDYGGTSSDTTSNDTSGGDGPTSSYNDLSDSEIKERLRRPNAFSPEDVQNAIDQAKDAGVSTADAFGNKMGDIGNETTRSLAVREMMQNAAGYNPTTKGYDNPFNTSMDLDLGYDTYNRMLEKGYKPSDIKNFEYNRYKGLLGDMKFDATLDGEVVGSFNMNKPGGFLNDIFGKGGFTFNRDYADQGNRGRDRTIATVNEEVVIDEDGDGVADDTEYLDASEYYLPSDYTSDRITAGDLVPGRRRFMTRKGGMKIPEGDSLTLDEIRDYAMLGGFSLLEPFSEYQARRREYYGKPDFGQGTDFDYSGSTGGGTTT